MKHFPNINMETGGNHDFPRLARESGFYFNLYSGRVDWKQIDSLDIDRLIRERDLESLQSVFSSISSCNLTNEYDVKVLDPNFVKLFRLSQLSVDYLQYCRNYLDHCVIVLQEQLRMALHEIEQLQQERQSKEEQIKQLTRKLKDKTKHCGNNGLTTNIADFGPRAVPGVPGTNSGFSQTSFRCAPCKKIFVSAIFLQRHIMRRHPEQVKLYSEAESLRLEVQQLQERLQKAEELLKQSNCSLEKDKRELSFKQEEETPNKDLEHEKKQSEQSEKNIRALIENVKRQNEEIEALKNQLKSQHFAQESLWQNRLDQLEQRHHSDIDGLRISLNQPSSITTLSASTTQLGNQTSKELNEKQVQSSPPEMAIKGTQIDSTPDRILPPPVQEAFTKPATLPNPAFSAASPKASPLILQRSSSPVKTESSNVVSYQRTPEGRQPATWQRPQIPRKEQPSVPENQSFSRMSGDVSLTETSTEESLESIKSQGTPPQRNESDTDESSSTTEDGIKKLSSLATQPQVLTPLREDIEGVMCRLLRELGIDPEWKGIPNATYQSIKANLQHQRAITQKGRRSLVKLRKDLAREVDRKCKNIYSTGGAQKDKPPVREAPARPPPPRRSPNKQENEYTAEPRRGRPTKPTVVYEEVKNREDVDTVPINDLQIAPVPLARGRSVEKPSTQTEKTAAPAPVPPVPVPVVPVPPPRVTPTTAELLADMEKLRQQGSFLKSEGSFTTKSNLKSTSSTGNLTKKRVVFMDEKEDFSTADLSFHDDEFGLFQSWDPANVTSSYLNKDRSLSTGGISHFSSSNFDNFSTNGGGEPTQSAAESKVARIAREIESQLMNKPKYPSRPTRLSTFDRSNSELDLILDDLSSS